MDELPDYWTKRLSSLCCVCSLSKLRLFNVQNFIFHTACNIVSSTSQRLIGSKKDSEEKCSFSLVGSLDLDEDDAKASCVYSNRVVAICLGPWF